MAIKRKNLYLYLVLVCFLGIIAIFIADGYIGVYDTIYVPAGEREQKIEADDWSRGEEWGRAEIGWGDKAFFRYEVDNRQFSSYTADIDVSVWHSREKLRDLISQEILIAAFDKGKLEWGIDTAELLPATISPEQGYEFTIIIKRGAIERRVILYVYPVAYPVKPVPVPPR